MAGLASDGSNPDVSLLYDINGFAKSAPGWFVRTMGFTGEYGILLAMLLLVLGCWWQARKRSDQESAVMVVAGTLWAPLAAGIAVLVNIPIRAFVARPRPFVEHTGLDVLLPGKTGFSFVSDQATLAMALGAGLFVANRKFGLPAIGLALAEGFCQVFMGVHYPTDVIGGFALGTAVTLLLSPLAMALLTPVVRAVARTERLWFLIRSGQQGEATAAAVDIPEPRPGRNDLAA